MLSAVSLNLLITVIFVLSDGSPAKDAAVYCRGVSSFLAGDDTSTTTQDSRARFIIDSRGALILEVIPGTKIDCSAYNDDGQYGHAEITETKKQIVRMK